MGAIIEFNYGSQNNLVLLTFSADILYLAG